jgi:stearoyl-CoA desaturase (Delta-9 desaturase)
MTRAEKIANLIGVVLPFAGAVAAVALLWNEWVDWFDLALFATTYLLFAAGITVGYHRLLTHRSFQTHKPLEYMWAVLGCYAVQGSPLDWVADHRKHHAHPDEEGDPHSPHVGHGSGLKGLWHAHTGWLFETQGQANWKKYARDLYEDRGMRWISKRFPWFALGTLILPALAGLAYHGGVEGFLRGLVWGGLLRVFLIHHVTWSINSVCHFFGRRRFETTDKSTNVAWLALPSLGESWHHNHHAFPRSAEHGMKWYEKAADPSAWIIKAMEKTGLAWNVVRISPERQAQREIGAQPPARPAPQPVAQPEREKVGV